MKFTINELDSKLFQQETNMQSIEHPHVYLQWMQIKMSEKLWNEMKKLNEAMQQLSVKG